jgi:alpha-1,2-mannosyltransferase
LHYVLNGKGMQTWEYAPVYAIRTYAFIMPIYAWCFLLKHVLGIKSSVLLFQGVRLLLGAVTAYSETQFISAIYASNMKSIAMYTSVFLIFSAGVFLSSTAFLPSAVAMSLVMLSFSSWLRMQFVWTIFWACVAVLWTGWPFVGVVFLPLGLHMLLTRIYFYDAKAKPARGGFIPTLQLVARGAAVLLLVGCSAAAIDIFMYRRWYGCLFALLIICIYILPVCTYCC